MGRITVKVEKKPLDDHPRYRDIHLSSRHIHWRFCPATDIDFFLIEYTKGKAVALVEYKHENAEIVDFNHPNIRAQLDLANRAQLPLFIVRYAADFTWWKVKPLNKYAIKWLPRLSILTEKEWVSLLYKMRGYKLPKDLFTDEGVLAG